jgi:heme/copper-type cytochrome/quinol oxidase subunit 4
MRHHWRLMATLAVCIVAYGVLLGAFRLLNASHDGEVFGGVAVIFALLAMLPVVLRTIWRSL